VIGYSSVHADIARQAMTVAEQMKPVMESIRAAAGVIGYTSVRAAIEGRIGLLQAELERQGHQLATRLNQVDRSLADGATLQEHYAHSAIATNILTTLFDILAAVFCVYLAAYLAAPVSRGLMSILGKLATSVDTLSVQLKSQSQIEEHILRQLEQQQKEVERPARNSSRVHNKSKRKAGRSSRKSRQGCK
jgi:hypothetical protein